MKEQDRKGSFKNGVRMCETVTCLSCGREVKVMPLQYGEGRIAVCPECKKLAYNGK